MPPRIPHLLGWLLTGAISVTAAIGTTAHAVEDPLDAYASVLAQAVRADGVRYGALVTRPLPLREVIEHLATAAEPTELPARLAFWIDAYNALTLAQVVDRLPADPTTWRNWSVRDQDGFWAERRFTVAGAQVTLDDIEHRRLRPLGEPRFHFAITSASRSCPPLALEPYQGGDLERKLLAATARFANDVRQTRLTADGVAVHPILDWFAEDFGGEAGVRRWLIAVLPLGEVRTRLEAGRPITTFDYDWGLNLATE